MKRVLFLLVLFMSSTSYADIYDWREKVEVMCNDNLSVLNQPIISAMRGGRPENVVVSKLSKEPWCLPTIQGLGNIDEEESKVILKSIVHSFFNDQRLRDPLNYSLDSYKKASNSCIKDVLNFDPKGKRFKGYLDKEEGREE